MEIWTTFCPSKISWELTHIKSVGKAPSSDWQKNLGLIDNSFLKLKHAGINGIRLVIYPAELTQNGKSYNWKPIEKILLITQKYKLKVDLCIGPFQYPYYPGIYLPPLLLRYVFDNQRCLDTITDLWDYGKDFLELQIKYFSKNKKIHGFHLGNEWPDSQNVAGKDKIKTCISKAFMIMCIEYLKKNTSKPISLNTNIDTTDIRNLSKNFREIFNILDKQGKLGFDIYPSQETWRKVPFLKLKRLVFGYKRSFRLVGKVFPKTELNFVEVEAQPWGGGQSWDELITHASNPKDKILLYTKHSLINTLDKYIKSTKCRSISLWGSDFWLSADMLGLKWPLDQVRELSKLL